MVILLRNVDPRNGLYNDISTEAAVINGSHAGNLILISKIELHPSDTHLPFQLCHVQRPFKLAYPVTINKAQGQTFVKVELLLPKLLFVHGQLYIVLSRLRSTTTQQGIKVKLDETRESGFV